MWCKRTDQIDAHSAASVRHHITSHTHTLAHPALSSCSFVAFVVLFLSRLPPPNTTVIEPLLHTTFKEVHSNTRNKYGAPDDCCANSGRIGNRVR